MNDPPYPALVAFCGFARAGKDEAGRALVALGYTRHNFADVIKRDLDPLVRRRLGFSTFTEDTAQKALIRRTLEAWGEDNYDQICEEYFAALPRPAVNTRLARAKEGARWRALGGVLLEVRRPGYGPETPWSERTLSELWAAGLVDGVVQNDGDRSDLRRSLLMSLDAFSLRSVRRA